MHQNFDSKQQLLMQSQCTGMWEGAGKPSFLGSLPRHICLQYLWAVIGETYNESGGTFPSCWFSPKVFWINCLKQLGKLIEYNIWRVTFICPGGDCWLGFSIALHMSTIYNISLSIRQVSCHVVGLNMERAIWSGHKFSMSENKKKYSKELYTIST